MANPCRRADLKMLPVNYLAMNGGAFIESTAASGGKLNKEKLYQVPSNLPTKPPASIYRAVRVAKRAGAPTVLHLVFEPVKFVMMFVKLGNCAISAALAAKIWKISPYMLNKVFSMAFSCWAVFIGTDAVLFVIAANSAILFEVANVLRAIGLLALSSLFFWFWLGGTIVKEGEELALGKQKRLIAMLVLAIVLAIAVKWFDSVIVYDAATFAPIHPANLPPPEGTFIVEFDFGWLVHGIDAATVSGFVAYLLYVAIILSLFLGIGILASVYHGVTKEKQRASLLVMTGIAMIPAGVGYFILLAFLNVPPDMRIVTSALGQAIWVLAPLLVFKGLSDSRG